MSKLYNNYMHLKNTQKNPEKTLYLFKSGIFYILLDEDAKIASKLLNLKTTYFIEDVVKCGFPINSINKYLNILKNTSYNFKIIENLENVPINNKTHNLLLKISNIDTDNLSIKEAYNFIDNIKKVANLIIEGEMK